MGDMSARSDDLPPPLCGSSKSHADEDGEDKELLPLPACVTEPRRGCLNGASGTIDGIFPEEDEMDEGGFVFEVLTANNVRRIFDVAASFTAALDDRPRFTVVLPVTAVVLVVVMLPRMTPLLPEILVDFLLVGADDAVDLDPRGTLPIAVLISKTSKRDY